MKYVYPCSIIGNQEDGEGFAVAFPDVYGANTGGKSYQESLLLAEDCLVAALGAYVYRGWDLPAPSPVGEGQEPVVVPPLVAAKLALYTAMRRQGVTRDALAERLGLNAAAIGTLLDPDRKCPIGQVTAALEAVGRKLVVEDRAA